MIKIGWLRGDRRQPRRPIHRFNDRKPQRHEQLADNLAIDRLIIDNENCAARPLIAAATTLSQLHRRPHPLPRSLEASDKPEATALARRRGDLKRATQQFDDPAADRPR